MQPLNWEMAKMSPMPTPSTKVAICSSGEAYAVEAGFIPNQKLEPCQETQFFIECNNKPFIDLIPSVKIT